MPDGEHGNDRGTVRHLAWRELFPWLSILQAFRLARDPRQLILAATGVLLTAGGWWLLAFAFSGTAEPATKHLVESYQVWPWQTPPPPRFELKARLDAHPRPAVTMPDLNPTAIVNPPATTGTLEGGLVWIGDEGRVDMPLPPPPGPLAAGPLFAPNWPHVNPIAGTWSVLSRPFIRLFERGATVTAFALSLLCALWATAVWGLFGGAITRLAAVRLARDERVPMGQAVRHARIRWSGYFWAPLFPLVGALLPTLGLAAVGWLLRFDIGLVVLGVLFPLMLVGGLLIVILVLGLLFGWPLMWATISAEGTDTFDALSRTYAYVYQRPLSYLFYVVVASATGLLAGALAWAVGVGVIYLTLWGASWTAGVARTEQLAAEVAPWVSIVRPVPVPVAIEAPRRSRLLVAAQDEMAPPSGSLAPLGPTGRFGARLIAIWIGAVELLIVAFNVSFFWSSATAVYFLLRKQVDATEPDEVYIEDEEERYGLPPLEKDAAGVDKAADVEPEVPPDSNGTGS